MTAWILVGGRLTKTAQLSTLPRPQLVIAADGGARHAQTLNCKVDLWVGDFDSSEGLNLDVPRQAFPADKNLTDTELAVDIAKEHGIKQIVFIGAFGGRFDHSAALLLGSLRLAEEGLDVMLTSGNEWGWPLLPRQPKRLCESTGMLLSIVACSELFGLNISGVRWPLHQANVSLGSGWTISNEIQDQEVVISLRQGRALVICTDPSHLPSSQIKD